MAAPVMGPISDVIVGALGDTILVEMGMHVGFEAATKVADDLVVDKAINAVIPIHSATFETTGVKELLITLKYKQTMTDAGLGFFRSSVHKLVRFRRNVTRSYRFLYAGTTRYSPLSRTISPSRRGGSRRTYSRAGGDLSYPVR